MSVALSPGARHVQIETPEHVRIGYELADLGSRFLALVLDVILFGVALFLIGFAVPLVLSRFDIFETLASLGFAVILIGLMLGFWMYFGLFEGLAGGRTPGKRMAGLRVIHEGGYPLTFRGAMVRNLIRLVDLQPLGTWIVGGAAMLMTPRTQRLGDLAAGTIVVRDRAKGTLPERAALAREAHAAPVLTYREFEVLSGYVARRTELQPEARARIAASLAGSLADHLAERAPVPETPPPGGWRGGDDLRNDGRLVALLEAERPRWRARGEGPAARSAQAVALVRAQSERWHDYRDVLERARRGLGKLPEDDLPRFAAMYREVAADLARARTYHGSIELQESLERLVGAGHNLLYRPIGRSWKALRAWVSGGFPALVRARMPVIALSALLLFGPMLATYAHVRSDPDVARAYLPVEMISRAENAADRAASGQGYVDIPSGFMPVFSTFLISNNVRVTLLAFAGGILAGLGTAAILIFNGMHVGAVFGLYGHHEASALIWGFVAPHGVLELTAIVISGAGGLWLGSALLVPGRMTRAEALRRRGREAVGLLAGTTVLLILAGLVEGFLSPAPLPPPIKYGFAALFALTMFAYLAGSGRSAEDRALADGITDRAAPTPEGPAD